jgi:hypothetical protein
MKIACSRAITVVSRQISYRTLHNFSHLQPDS